MDNREWTVWLLDGNGAARKITLEEATSWHREQGTLWICGGHTADGQRERDLEQCGVDHMTIKAVSETSGHPRLALHNDELMLALRAMNPESGSGHGPRMVPINLWTGEGRILTVVHHEHPTPLDSLASRLQAGHGPRNAGEFVITLLQELANLTLPVVTSLVEEAEELGQQVYSTHAGESLNRRLGQMRHTLNRCLHHLDPQAQAIHNLWQARPALLDAKLYRHLGEIKDQFRRINQDISSTLTQLKGFGDELNTQIDHRLNQHVYFLTLFNGVLLPLMFLTSLLGVNLGGIPGADNPYGFGLLCLLLAGMGWMMFWLFKRKKWWS